MNWDALGAIGELVGALAVVATLMYLAKQIRDNSVQLKANSINDIATLFNDAFQPIYNDEKSRAIWIDGLSGAKEMSEYEQGTFDLFMHRLVNPFEVVLSHYEKGVLEEDTFQGYVARIQAMGITTPGGKDWYKRNRELLSPTLRRFIDENTDAGT